MVIISGLSRSGTSILSKIVGSFKDVLTLHEPLILRYLPTLAQNNLMNFKLSSHLLKGVLFEDYYLQILQGRRVNFRPSDNSYFGNYERLTDVKRRWVRYRRRSDVLKDLNDGKYTFALKISELQSLYPVLERIFKGVKFIEIVRNGQEVISSSLKRGWYTDDYLNARMNEWAQFYKVKIPWYVQKRDLRKFAEWNSATRIAYIWRVLSEKGVQYGKRGSDYLRLRYEQMAVDPEKTTELCDDFLRLYRTTVTAKHIKAIKNHPLTEHREVAREIEKSERLRFEKMMLSLNYK
jgi:hypothetical protein